jgi:hypothetical protein
LTLHQASFLLGYGLLGSGLLLLFEVSDGVMWAFALTILMFNFEASTILVQAREIFRPSVLSITTAFCRSCFSLVLLLFYIIPASVFFFGLTINQGAVSKSEAGIYFIAISMLLALSITNHIIVFWLFNRKSIRDTVGSPELRIGRLGYFSFFVLLIGLFPKLISSISNVGYARTAMIESGGIRNINSAGDTQQAITVSLIVAIGVFSIIFLRSQKSSINLLTTFGGFLMASLPATETDTRSLYAFAFLALFVRFAIDRRPYLIIILFMAGLLGLSVLTSLRHGLGAFSLFSSMQIVFLGDSNFFRELVTSVGLAQSSPLGYESQIYMFLSGFFPRFLWESKPISSVVIAYTRHFWGEYSLFSGNVLPGIIGQYVLGEGIAIGFVSFIFTLFCIYAIQLTILRRSTELTSDWQKAVAICSVLLFSMSFFVSGRFLSSFNFVGAFFFAGLTFLFRKQQK